MCEANAYVYRDGIEELYLESVDMLVPEEKTVFLKSLFGEQKTFQGRVKEISLLRHRIILEESA
jgi:predicted RNA-binding protein